MSERLAGHPPATHPRCPLCSLRVAPPLFPLTWHLQGGARAGMKAWELAETVSLPLSPLLVSRACLCVVCACRAAVCRAEVEQLAKQAERDGRRIVQFAVHQLWLQQGSTTPPRESYRACPKTPTLEACWCTRNGCRVCRTQCQRLCHVAARRSSHACAQTHAPTKAHARTHEYTRTYAHTRPSGPTSVSIVLRRKETCCK